LSRARRHFASTSHRRQVSNLRPALRAALAKLSYAPVYCHGHAVTSHQPAIGGRSRTSGLPQGPL